MAGQPTTRSSNTTRLPNPSRPPLTLNNMTFNQRIEEKLEHLHMMGHIVLSMLGLAPQEIASLLDAGLDDKAWPKIIKQIRVREGDTSLIGKWLDAIEGLLKTIQQEART